MSNMEARGVGTGGVAARSKTKTSLDDVYGELNSVHRTLNGVKDRLDRFEKDTKKRLGNLHDAMDSQFRSVNGRFDSLETRFDELEKMVLRAINVAKGRI